MMLQAPKGTKDVLPSQSAAWQYVEQIIREICKTAGFREMRTPVFEHTELFQRGVGDTTDVVQKEMYTFQDKGDRSITLKPEGTAGAARAFVEHGLFNEPMPLKMYYLNCPVFRYEAPQSGRLREHHQFGIEVFGAKDATEDAEVIGIAMRVIEKLGIGNLSLNINSIGCPSCRPQYQGMLKEFFRSKLGGMCKTCNERFERNPLRMLDCKEEVCKQACVGAPKMLDCLCDECVDHFAKVQTSLNALSIPLTVDTDIVRGLDYYTKTVFEIIATLPDGSKLTACGGGRYDGLVETIGGPQVAGIGFGMGIERILMAMENQGVAFVDDPLYQVYVASMGAQAHLEAFVFVDVLRRAGISADCDHVGRSLKAQFKYAGKVACKYVVIIGEDELTSGLFTLRDMQTKQEQSLTPVQIISSLKR